MKQWEIYLFPFRREQPHPAVIISNDERCANPDYEEVNALLCTSVRLTRPLKPTEVALDEEDGLDWLTAVRCDFIYTLDKSQLRERRGMVTLKRRAAIVGKMISTLRWPKP